MTDQEQREKLRQWLELYVRDRRLAGAGDAVEDGGAGGDAGGGERVDFGGEAGVQAGQIRLWPAVDGGSPPCYGVVLRAAGYGMWRVVPVSPLGLPGVPGELRVMEEPPVQVVQGWNCRVVPAGAVAASWVAGALPDAEVFRLEGFLLGLEAGEVPEGCRERAGPPLVHPLDPRHEYLDEERERVDRVLGAASAFLGGEGSDSWSEAAEPEGDYEV